MTPIVFVSAKGSDQKSDKCQGECKVYITRKVSAKRKERDKTNQVVYPYKEKHGK